MKCQGCEKEIATGLWCDACRDAFKRFQERQEANEKLTKKVSKCAHTASVGLCKLIQKVTPVVKGAVDGAKKAWNEAKEK